MPEENGTEKPIIDVGSLIVTNAQDAERVENLKKADQDIRNARILARQEMKDAEKAKKEVAKEREKIEKEKTELQEKAQKLAKQGSAEDPEWIDRLEKLSLDGKFGNSDYLLELFEDADLKYLKSIKKDCEKKGFPETPVFTEYLFLTTINHRLHISYVISTKHSQDKKGSGQILDTINKNQERISSLEANLTKLAQEEKEGEDIPALHQKVLGAAEKFIREHAGEFSFVCKNCNTVVQSDGLPHWALEKGEYEGARYYFVFNSQLWQLVLEKKVSVAYMAFALRTSILGIKFTVEARREKWPDWIEVLKEERTLKELMDTYKFAGIEGQKKHIESLGS